MMHPPGHDGRPDSPSRLPHAASWNRQGFHLDTGGIFIDAACLCWGIDNNLTRRLSSADPVQIAMIKGRVAGWVNFATALWLGTALPPASLVAAGAVTGFSGVGQSRDVHAGPLPAGHRPNATTTSTPTTNL